MPRATKCNAQLRESRKKRRVAADRHVWRHADQHRFDVSGRRNVVEVITGVNLPMVIKLATHTRRRFIDRDWRVNLRSGTAGNLSRRRSAGATGKRAELIEVAERKVQVTSRLGLHARAAANLVRVASQFESKLNPQRIDGDVEADAKSILSILTLAASRGTDLSVVASGRMTTGALDAVVGSLLTRLR